MLSSIDEHERRALAAQWGATQVTLVAVPDFHGRARVLAAAGRAVRRLARAHPAVTTARALELAAARNCAEDLLEQVRELAH